MTCPTRSQPVRTPYIPADHTDIRKTFARIRRELNEQRQANTQTLEPPAEKRKCRT